MNSATFVDGSGPSVSIGVEIRKMFHLNGLRLEACCCKCGYWYVRDRVKVQCVSFGDEPKTEKRRWWTRFFGGPHTSSPGWWTVPPPMKPKVEYCHEDNCTICGDREGLHITCPNCGYVCFSPCADAQEGGSQCP